MMMIIISNTIKLMLRAATVEMMMTMIRTTLLMMLSPKNLPQNQFLSIKCLVMIISFAAFKNKVNVVSVVQKIICVHSAENLPSHSF